MYAKGTKSKPATTSPRKGSLTNQSAKTSTSQAPPTASVSQSPSSTSQSSTTSSREPTAPSEPIPFATPLVMTPVSQVNVGHRRMSRVPPPPVDSMAYDPMRNNPDGSLKTMYTIPNFSKSYAQAMQARYVRHNEKPVRDQELSIQEIFDKK